MNSHIWLQHARAMKHAWNIHENFFMRELRMKLHGICVGSTMIPYWNINDISRNYTQNSRIFVLNIPYVIGTISKVNEIIPKMIGIIPYVIGIILQVIGIIGVPVNFM